MILIIGGAFQGKCAYAVKTYDLRPEDICDLAREDPVPGTGYTVTFEEGRPVGYAPIPE